MHAGLPQIAMNFPEYQKINRRHKIAVLVDDLTVDSVANAIEKTMQDKALLHEMQANALEAREIYCWQAEENLLLQFYRNLFGE